MLSFISASRIFGHVVILFSFFLLSSCDDELSSNFIQVEQLKGLNQRILSVGSSDELITFIALNDAQQAKGVSSIATKDFKTNYAMLFPGKRDQIRRFWMPDTYFDLDIFFLDKNFKVLDIQRDVPHHPGNDEPPAIARTKDVFCRHVLEIKSSSPIAKKIRLGQTLKWKN